MTTDDRLLLLDPRDSVFVVRARVRAGERIAVEGREVVVAADLPLGHKVARRAIAAGAHVHVHNVKSDYTPTYHLEDIRAALGEGA